MSLRRVAAVSLALLMVMAGTSCAREVDGRAVSAPPETGQPGQPGQPGKPGQPGRPGANAGPVQWDRCPPGVRRESPKVPRDATCGTLTVPVDYAKPDGPTASLALIRIPATGDKIGSLVINPGGPGQSGVTTAADLVRSLPDEVRQSFDLIGFDPRGVSGSQAAVWCNSDADNDASRAEVLVDYSAQGVALIEQRSKEFVQRCVDKVGLDFLANVGTVNVAKDLDMLRAALGDDKLTYLGYSYGTSIGAAYAEMFPDKVRALVLDGAVDPNADPVEANIRQAAAFQKAFDEYAADCAKSPDCPLGTDPNKAVDVYKSLIEPLIASPAPTDDPRGLSYNDAQTGTVLSLYSSSYWPLLTDGLNELKDDGDGDTLLKLADLYWNRDAEGHYDNSTDARTAINCVDDGGITDRAKVIDQDRRGRIAAPFWSYGQFTGNAPLGVCAFWPVPQTSKPHEIAVQGLPRTIVVSITNDPATPYQAGVDLARQLGAALITVDGNQHTIVFSDNTCVDGIVAKYLVDPAAPVADATC